MTNNTATHTSPTHIVWFAPKRENAPWLRAGALWPTKNGKGFNMSLDLTPVAPGSLVILPNEPKAEGEGA